MVLIRAIAAWFGIHRGLLTLVVIASIGGALYVAWQHMIGERDRLRAWIDVTCASAGAGFDDVSTLGMKDGRSIEVKLKPGALCQRNVVALAAFKRESDARTAEILADAMKTRDAKLGVDAEAARRDAAAARAATERMEKADAEIAADDRVGGAWFRALNDLAGLRGQDDR